MDTFAKRLRHLMDLKKINQQGVATGISVNRSRTSLWLNGKTSDQRRETFQKLSEFFGCSIDWLAEGKGDPFPLPEMKTAENVASFEPYKAARDADSTLAKIMREKFKQQCTVHLDEFFDFIAENYGESKEGIDQFLAELHSTHSNYRVWLEEKNTPTKIYRLVAKRA